MRLLPNGQDEDRNLVAVFKQISVPNQGKSKEANRPIFDDVDVCEIRYPGTRNTGMFPAESFSHWATDPETGEQVKVTYAERFSRQYRQFKEKSVQTKSGTPLDYAVWLTEGRRAELRALNVYTIEALAAVDGQELKNLGPMGRDAKNKAAEYLAQANTSAATAKLQLELDTERERTAMLKADLEILKAKTATEKTPATIDENSDFAEMSDDQLKDYIASNSGTRPLGNPNRKTLLRMAKNCQPRDSAA